MQRAAETLADGSNVKWVANELSYKTSQYFFFVFKKFHGCAPAQYARRIRAGEPGLSGLSARSLRNVRFSFKNVLDQFHILI